MPLVSHLSGVLYGVSLLYLDVHVDNISNIRETQGQKARLCRRAAKRLVISLRKLIDTAVAAGKQGRWQVRKPGRTGQVGQN